MAKETLKFDTEVEKIFHLMIHSIYENKEIFLRELISNASDACDKLRYKAVTTPDILGSETDLQITVSADKNAGTVTISDNGIGMSKADIIKNLGTVARSGTERFAKEITGDEKKDSNLIGQFGVGFYSSFMVAEKVTVISRAAGGKKAHRWESKGTGSYTIEEIKDETPRGTSVTLHVRKDEKEYLDSYRLRHVIETYSNHIAFPILLNAEGNQDTVNSGKALWARSKSDINEEEYKEFYHSVSQMGQDDPWMTLHNKVEGVIEYTNLLYVPSSKPFDLFHPDRSTRVKLYVKRVFIAEEGVDILPAYLRFVRGVVDSEDLPLNVSREVVQNNAVLQKIKSGVTKRILKELKAKMDKDLPEYMKFWDNFGPVVKEGLCDGMEPRDDLIEICRFRSTRTEGDETVTLKEYKERMVEGQDAIYFITADDTKSALASPQLEGFKKKGYEVLILTDSVDDFWVNVLFEYKDVTLKSVTRSGTEDDLDEAKDETKDEDKTPDNAKIGDHESAELIAFIKDNLGDRIKDVRTTTRLTDSPVCLVAADGAMDIRMERFMVNNKQLAEVNTKVFEINPEHPIVIKLADDVAGNANIKTLSDTVHLLFAQANIIEGEPVDDIAAFSKRMNDVMTKALAA